jgi:hypothetical protein
MKISFLTTSAAIAALATLLVTGCASNSPQAAKTSDEVATTSASKTPDAKESTKAESGKAVKVVGVNGREGEVIGQAAATSKFKTVQIGMSVRQAMEIAGQPTDEGSYITGKAFIPFYFGGDTYRFELAYKGQGRLIFAGNSPWTGAMGTTGNLVKIIHNAKDSGYRD